MASIFKRKRKVKLDSGKTVVRQSRKYYTRLAGADGTKRTIPLYTDKTASEQRAAQLQKEFELADAGVVTVDESSKPYQYKVVHPELAKAADLDLPAPEDIAERIAIMTA